MLADQRNRSSTSVDCASTDSCTMKIIGSSSAALLLGVAATAAVSHVVIKRRITSPHNTGIRHRLLLQMVTEYKCTKMQAQKCINEKKQYERTVNIAALLNPLGGVVICRVRWLVGWFVDLFVDIWSLATLAGGRRRVIKITVALRAPGGGYALQTLCLV